MNHLSTFLVALTLIVSIPPVSAHECETFPADYTVSNPLSFSGVEQQSLDEIKRSSNPNIPKVPFGFINSEWNEFKAQFEDNDKLIHFRSSKESWQALAGIEGYAIVRKECVVFSIVTLLS